MICGLLDFNPRPLAGATLAHQAVGRCQRISIHAPLRGRLALLLNADVKKIISIHAPLRGRQRFRLHQTGPAAFQSTPPCGGDHKRHAAGDSGSISIHAPLRGRRPRSPRSMPHSRFQSTPPCGGDRRGKDEGRKGMDFNPRPLAGATAAAGLKLHSDFISIHAPLRGRRGIQYKEDGTDRFQSTPPCGGDHEPG